jgi:hypothetical protein
MNDEAESPYRADTIHAAPVTGRSGVKKGILIGCGSALGLLALTIAGLALMLKKTQAEDVPAATFTIEEFLQAMATRDRARLRSIIAAPLREVGGEEKLLAWTDEQRVALCEDVREVEVARWKSKVGTMGTLPSGTYLEMSGRISYTDDTDGAFEAVLMKSGNRYELVKINVYASEDRVENIRMRLGGDWTPWETN